jgi:hypothetical protein
MKILSILFLIMFTASCSLISSVNDYVDENHVIVNIATSQVVSRFIDAGATDEDKQKRAIDFSDRANRVLEFIDGNPLTTVDGLLIIIDSAVDWEKLSYPDKILIGNIILLIEVELRKVEGQELGFNVDTTFAIRSLFNVAIKTADAYL